MKRLTALLLAGVLVFGCVGCGNNNAGTNGGNSQNTESSQQEENQGSKVEIADANDILTKVWNEYVASGSDDIQFPIAGGNVETAVMDAPAKFDLSIEFAQDALVSSYCIPAESVAMTDDIATMMNMMMANNFTCAAYHLTDAANAETFINSIKDATLGNHWMCGFPEKFVAVKVGDDYVVTAFGHGSIIDHLKTSFTTVYGDAASVVVEENIGE